MQGLSDLLALLPTVDSDASSLVANGHLLSGPDGCHRLVLNGVYLDLSPDDILSVRQTGPIAPAAVPVEVEIRLGASLLGIGPSTPFRDFIATRRVPFAILCRPPNEAHRYSIDKRTTEFHLREGAFLRKYGLITTPSPQ